MQKIFRTYARSKTASIVSVGGVVLSILLGIAAIVCLIICFFTENAVMLASAIACIALGILCYKFSGRLAEQIALQELEERFGKPSNKD